MGRIGNEDSRLGESQDMPVLAVWAAHSRIPPRLPAVCVCNPLPSAHHPVLQIVGNFYGELHSKSRKGHIQCLDVGKQLTHTSRHPSITINCNVVQSTILLSFGGWSTSEVPLQLMSNISYRLHVTSFLCSQHLTLADVDQEHRTNHWVETKHTLL